MLNQTIFPHWYFSFFLSPVLLDNVLTFWKWNYSLGSRCFKRVKGQVEFRYEETGNKTSPSPGLSLEFCHYSLTVFQNRLFSWVERSTVNVWCFTQEHMEVIQSGLKSFDPKPWAIVAKQPFLSTWVVVKMFWFPNYVENCPSPFTP